MAPATRTAFLLGAGASFEAGLPMLGKLGEDVHAELSAPERRLFRALLLDGTGSPGDGSARNLEDVLSAADSLAASRLHWGRWSPRDLSRLAFEVRRQVWRRLSQPFETDYLEQLRKVLEALGTLRLFSLNNDLVIERWCREQRLDLFRGFAPDGTFDPGPFAVDGSPVQLVKVHGSLDWKLDETQRLHPIGTAFTTSQRTLPLRTPLPELMVVFPSRAKVLMEPPLLRLFQHFGETLLQLDRLVVVGCRLGDAHIFAAIVAALQRNQHLQVLLLDPWPAETLGRLLGALHKDRGAQERVDCLAIGFRAALAGPFLEHLGEAPGARPSLGQALLGVVWHGADARSLARLRSALERLPFAALDVELGSARTLLAGFEPPACVEGRGPDLLREALAAVGSPPDAAHAALTNLADQWRSAPGLPLVPLSRSLGAHGEKLYVVPKTEPRALSLVTPAGLVRVGRHRARVSALEILGDRAYMVQPTLGRFEGLGLLRELDLATGRKRALLLRRKSGAGAAWTHLREIFALLRRLPRAPASSLQDLKSQLLAVGFLNFSSSLCALDPEHLVVLESRWASLVHLPDRRVVATTPSWFLNLEEAVAVEGRAVYLLERGVAPESEGCLWLWKPNTSRLTRVLPRVRYAAGLAFDPAHRRLLLTLNPPTPQGELWEIPLGANLQPSRPPTRLLTGLPNPRTIRQVGGRTWIVSGWGLLRLD